MNREPGVDPAPGIQKLERYHTSRTGGRSEGIRATLSSVIRHHPERPVGSVICLPEPATPSLIGIKEEETVGAERNGKSGQERIATAADG